MLGWSEIFFSINFQNHYNIMSKRNLIENLKRLWWVVGLRLNNTSLMTGMGIFAHGQEVPGVPRKV